MVRYYVHLNLICMWGVLLLFNIVDSREELKMGAWDWLDRLYLRAAWIWAFCGLVPTSLWLSCATQHQVESPWAWKTTMFITLSYATRVFGPSRRGPHREASIRFAFIPLCSIAHLVWRHLHS